MIYYKCIELFRNLLVSSSREIGGDVYPTNVNGILTIIMTAPKFIDCDDMKKIAKGSATHARFIVLVSSRARPIIGFTD